MVLHNKKSMVYQGRVVQFTVESLHYIYCRQLVQKILKKRLQDEQTLIILHPKLGQMVNGIVLPIKKVFGLVDSKISVEIKDEGRKLQGRLVAVDEYLNIHMDETIEYIDNQRGRSLGTVVIRGNNILTIAPVI
jgi:small nuclear ribonucleoprotein (snRNP)-like protein